MSENNIIGDDMSEFDGEDIEQFEYDEPWDGFRSDAEADADVLKSAGYGTDEDYGYYGNDEDIEPFEFE
jgi:hypothetical protein